MPVTASNIRVTFIGAVTVACVVGCGGASDPRPAAPAAPTSASTAALPTTDAQAAPADIRSCAALGGTVDAHQTCDVHIAEAGYTIDMTFPVDYPDQRQLTSFLAQSRDDFVDMVGERPARDFPYELTIEAAAYRSGTPSTGTQNVVFTMYSDSGGAHPVTNYQAFNYDVSRQVPITFATLFKPGTDPVDVLNPIVRQQLAALWEGSSNPMPDDPPGATAYQDFAITDDAVIFFLSQGLWLPQVAGPREVSVPRTDLASILST